MQKYLYRGKPISSREFEAFKSANPENYADDYAVGSLVYTALDGKCYICALDVSSPANMPRIYNPKYRIEVDFKTVESSSNYTIVDGKQIFRFEDGQQIYPLQNMV